MAVIGGIAWYAYTSQMSGFWNLVSTNAVSVSSLIIRVAASAATRGVAKKTRARVLESRIASGDAATFFTSAKLKCGDRATEMDCTEYNRAGKGIYFVRQGDGVATLRLRGSIEATARSELGRSGALYPVFVPSGLRALRASHPGGRNFVVGPSAPARHPSRFHVAALSLGDYGRAESCGLDVYS